MLAVHFGRNNAGNAAFSKKNGHILHCFGRKQFTSGFFDAFTKILPPRYFLARYGPVSNTTKIFIEQDFRISMIYMCSVGWRFINCVEASKACAQTTIMGEFSFTIHLFRRVNCLRLHDDVAVIMRNLFCKCYCGSVVQSPSQNYRENALIIQITSCAWAHRWTNTQLSLRNKTNHECGAATANVDSWMSSSEKWSFKSGGNMDRKVPDKCVNIIHTVLIPTTRVVVASIRKFAAQPHFSRFCWRLSADRNLHRAYAPKSSPRSVGICSIRFNLSEENSWVKKIRRWWENDVTEWRINHT